MAHEEPALHSMACQSEGVFFSLLVNLTCIFTRKFLLKTVLALEAPCHSSQTRVNPTGSHSRRTALHLSLRTFVRSFQARGGRPLLVHSAQPRQK